VDDRDVPFDDPNQRNLVASVSEKERTIYPGKGKTVVVVDCGAKGSIIENLRARGQYAPAERTPMRSALSDAEEPKLLPVANAA
jgi:carbamoylphosphate synthase small subunit